LIEIFEALFVYGYDIPNLFLFGTCIAAKYVSKNESNIDQTEIGLQNILVRFDLEQTFLF